MTQRNLTGIGVLLTAVVLVFGAGCTTQVRVTSTPPGADVFARGSGRGAYRWSYKGATPTNFPSPYNAVWTKVRWPDGIYSEDREINILWKKEAAVHFDESRDAVRDGVQRNKPAEAAR